MTREDKVAYNYARERLDNDDYPVYSDEYELEHAFKAGIEYANRWISVKDEQPQCNIPHPNWDGSASDVMESAKVIALIYNCKVCIATFNQNIDEKTKKPVGEPYWFDEGKDEDGGWIDGKVTHWLPLPEETKWTEHILQRDKDGFLVGEVTDPDTVYKLTDYGKEVAKLLEENPAMTLDEASAIIDKKKGEQQ